MLSSSQIITTSKPTSSFCTGRMPFLSPNQQCQSTEGKISHSMDLLTSSSSGVFQLCLWPSKSNHACQVQIQCHDHYATKLQFALFFLHYFVHLRCISPVYETLMPEFYSQGKTLLVLLLRTSSHWNETFFIWLLNGVFSRQASYSVLLKGRWD